MQGKFRSLMVVITASCCSCMTVPQDRTGFRYSSVDSGAWPFAIREQLAAVFKADYAVRRQATPFCSITRGTSGALLDSLANYPHRSRDMVSAQTGLSMVPEVIAIAEGSPADHYGLKTGDRIVQIGGRDLQTGGGVALTPEATINAQAALDGSGDDTSITIRLRRGGETIEIDLLPKRTCAGYSALVLEDDPKAFSDSQNVAVTTGLVEMIAAPGELSFVVGHELAHTIFADSEDNGLSRREKERRADLFATHINRCLDINAQTGPDLLRRLDAYDWTSWMPKPSHPSTSKRSAAMIALREDLSCSDRSVLSYLTQNARS